MKFFISISIIFLSLTGFSQQETKVYIKSSETLGRFYVYMDSVLLNRSPQMQVGIIDLDRKPTYNIRVVFQDHDQKPVSGTIKPKKNKTRLYLLDQGTKAELESRKRSGRSNELPIPGDIAPSHPSMPDYEGRLGCDFPIGNEILDQTISLMQTAEIADDNDLETRVDIKNPVGIAKESIISYCYSIDQYRHFLKVLDKEEDKIELSKTAWYYLYDQDNFGKLENEFQDPASLQTILNYVQENQ
jgi:hypothetical protein